MLHQHLPYLIRHLGGGEPLLRIVVPLCLLVLALLPSHGHGAERAFAQRFVTNAKGDVHVIGNTLLNTSGAFVNIDGAISNSSSADLTLPSDATVLWAGLYWAGERPNNNTVYPNIKIKTPASGGYISLTAQINDLGLPPNQGNAYLCFTDITGYVRTGGAGTYTVADIVANTGGGAYAGWGLVVAFESDTMPLRNLAVYDGFYYIGNNSRPIATLTGFTTPLNGPVGTSVGFLAGNGRAGSSGDGLLLSNTALSDPQRAAGNFFVSRATDLGVDITRNPQQADLYGWDVGRVNASGVLANNVNSATIEFTGGSDKYFPYAFTFATEIYVPIIAPNITKVGTDVNGGLLVPGDIIRYEIAMSNSGYDTGTNVILTDPIPAYTTYVPGSMQILTGANSGVKTDAFGDDQADYCTPDTTPSCPVPQAIIRLGNGADASVGGSMPHLAATSLSFDVQLDPAIPAGTVLTNSAFISYSGQTLGASFAATSSQAAAAVYTPPSAIKSFSPNPIDVNGISTLTIQLTNSGPNQTTVTGVAFDDIYPAGLVNTATPSPSLICSAGASATRTGGTAGGDRIGIANGIFPPNGSCTLTVSVTSAASGNYTNQTSDITSDNTGSAPGASATLSVGNQVIAKTFAPTRILVTETSTTTFTITNPAVVPLTGLAFTDAMPAGLQVAAGAQSNGCGGTLTAVAGSSGIELSGGTIAASSACVITVPVTSPGGGYFANTTSAITSDQGDGLPSNTAYLTVVAPPMAGKSFSPSSVSPGASSTLSITVNNPNTTASISGVVFTDTFPLGMVHTASPNPTLTCTSGSIATLNSTAGSIGISSGSLAPGGSCTAKVNITANTVGDYVNTTGSITSTNGGTGAAANATFNISNLIPPTTTVSFAPSSLPAGQSSTMTITLSNANGTDITGAAFIIPYPMGLVNATPANAQTTCGGTVTAATGGTSLVFTGGIIAAGGSCTVSVAVTAAIGGTYYVSTGAINTANGGVGAGASGNVKFVAPPYISKTFLLNPIGVSPATTTMRITLTNPGVNTESLTGVGFTDIFPTGLLATPSLVNTCNGTASVPLTNDSLSLTGASLAPNSSCSVSVNVSAALPGNYVNTTSAVTSSNGGTGLTASATLSVAQPGISMAFSPATILYGNNTTLTITLSNLTPTAMTGAAFTNTYPASLTNAAIPNAGTTCGGTITAVANGGFISLAGGTIPANGTCSVTVSVKGTASVTNTIPAGGLTIDGGSSNANAASAFLSVTPPPTASKLFSKNSMPINDTAIMTITIANPTAMAMSGISFTDSYPGGGALTNFAAASLVCTTGSSATITGGIVNGTSVGISGGSIGANGNCTVTVTITATVAGTYNNSTGPVAWSMGGIPGGPAPAATAIIDVLQPFTFGKSFTPGTISVYDQSLLTVTLSNQNNVAVTGVAFTDTYNANIVNATPSGVASSCGGVATADPGTNILSLAGGTIPAASGGIPGTCQVTVYVTSSSISTPPGWANTLNFVSSANDGTTATPATAYLQVVRLLAPTVSKSFATDPIQTGSTSQLTVTIVNPNSMPILGAGFTDTYPVQIKNSSLPGAATTCPGATVAAAANGGTLTLATATIPADGECSVTVNVTSSVVGTWTNSIAAVTSVNAESSAAAEDTLTVILIYPQIVKTFTPDTVGPNTPARLRLVLTNANGVPLTDVAFTDTFPTAPGEMWIALGSNTQTDCGGTLTAVPEAKEFTLAGATLAGSAGCTIELDVLAFTAGTYTNTVALSSAETGAGPTSSADLTVLQMPVLDITRIVDPAGFVDPGGLLTHTITLTNVGNDPAVTVKIQEELSPFTAMCLDSYAGQPFDFVTVVPGLTVSASSYADDTPPTWSYVPVLTGCDQAVTHWLVELAGSLATGESCTIHYKAQVN